MLNFKLPLLLILVLWISAAHLFGQQNLPQPYIQSQEDGLVYDASFTYKDRQVSGLLVAKSEADGYRIMLLSKLGPTLMDFTLTDTGVQWKKKIEQLDKPTLLKAMEKDFRTILLTPLDQPDKFKPKNKNRIKVKKEISLLVSLVENKVMAAETKGFINFFKSFATFYYTDGDAVPDEICLTHRNVKLKLELKQLAN